MSCRTCGKDVPTSICVDCFADEVRAARKGPPYIKENRFGGDLIELGVVHALFEDMPRSEVGVTSGAQSAFHAAREFIKGMTANQCKLAGCKLSGDPYGSGDKHTDICWFGIRANFYADRAKALSAASNNHE